MTNNTLHYIFDPMCGWCYAAAPLLKAASDIDGLNIELHAGGLWMGHQVKAVTPQLRAFVIPNDQRIAQLTGQEFGENYFNGLLNDTSAVLDSEPPTQAILAARQLSGGNGLAFLHRIQEAHFVKGLKVNQRDTLTQIAKDLGLDGETFTQTFKQTDTQTHIKATRQLMNQWHVQGFPSLILERDGQFQKIPHEHFYGHPIEFRNELTTIFNHKGVSK